MKNKPLNILGISIIVIVLLAIIGSFNKKEDTPSNIDTNTSVGTESIAQVSADETQSLITEDSEPLEAAEDISGSVLEEKTPTNKETISKDSIEEAKNGSEKETKPEQADNVTTPTLGTSGISAPPSFDGTPYAVVNGNQPYFTEEEKKCVEPFEMYSNLDSLGRCGQAYANICIELMPTEERGEIGMIKPSGWHTVKYAGIVDGNYLYNRCHLVGFQLAGENANDKNLITGTRYLNVDGMLPFENDVASYVRKTDNHVLYRVTPIFEGNNLVCSGVEIEAFSVEDHGEGICFNIYCYNAQPGVVINYADGNSSLDESVQVVENTPEPTPSSTQAPVDPTPQVSTANEQSADYIINTNTGIFHLPGCKSVSQMKEKNKEYYTGSYGNLINMGYKPCQNCLGR